MLLDGIPALLCKFNQVIIILHIEYSFVPLKYTFIMEIIFFPIISRLIGKYGHCLLS